MRTGFPPKCVHQPSWKWWGTLHLGIFCRVKYCMCYGAMQCKIRGTLGWLKCTAVRGTGQAATRNTGQVSGKGPAVVVWSMGNRVWAPINIRLYEPFVIKKRSSFKQTGVDGVRRTIPRAWSVMLSFLHKFITIGTWLGLASTVNIHHIWP